MDMEDTPVEDLAVAHPLAIIGAGRAALHLACRLPSALLSEVVVVDCEGPWLSKFSATIKSHQVDVLRSPVTQVPFVNVLGLQKYAEENLRTKSDFVSSSKKFMPLPTSSIFLEYSGLEATRVLGPRLQVRRGRVVSLTPIQAAEAARLKLPAGIRLRLDNGSSLVAHQVVYCGDYSVTNVPAFVRAIIPPPPSLLPSSSSSSPNSGHTSQPPSSGATSPGATPPYGSRLQFASEVVVSEAGVRGEVVVVVGGGMTSAHLACAALDQGAQQVVLVSRHNIKKREFEVDPMYFGNKGLYEFKKSVDMRERLKMCVVARGQASINLLMWRRLQVHLREGRLDILQESQVTRASWDGGQWRVIIKANSDIAPGELSPEPRPQDEVGIPSPPPDEEETSPAGGLDDIDDEDEDEYPQSTSQNNGEDDTGMIADRIWIAAGSHLNIREDPLLGSLIPSAPVRVVGGLPVLEEKSLRWPGLPLYLMGGYSTLALGPGARMMPGYRTAAERVVVALKDHALQAIQGEDPYSIPAGALPLDLEVDEEEDDAVGAGEVSATGGKTPSGVTEMHAALLQEHHAAQQVKPSLKRAEVLHMDGIIGSLPRRVLEKYSWSHSDDGIQVHIYLPIDEPVSRNSVHVQFMKRSLDLWVVCEKAAYRFNVMNLYKDVIPEHCYFKVQQRSQRVVLILKKYDTNPWRFLRS